MTNAKLQRELGVADFELVLVGHTRDGRRKEIWFEQGRAHWWNPGAEEGVIRIRRGPKGTKSQHLWTGVWHNENKWLWQICGNCWFTDDEYDEVLAKLSEHGLGLERQGEPICA